MKFDEEQLPAADLSQKSTSAQIPRFLIVLGEKERLIYERDQLIRGGHYS